jgi:hypothetical protein
MIDLETLNELEDTAIKALVKQASEGNNAAAASALVAIERVRKTRHAELHQAKMETVKDNPAELAAYLATLGQTAEQVAMRLGRKLTKPEQTAWERATDERLLEVRAVELGRMRRGEADVPRWATKGA